jgi:hypothetical protein
LVLNSLIIATIGAKSKKEAEKLLLGLIFFAKNLQTLS